MRIQTSVDFSFSAPQNYNVGENPQSVILADTNKDGHLDLVVSNWGDNSTSILTGNGEGSFFAQPILNKNFRLSNKYGLGYLNQDKYLDKVDINHDERYRDAQSRFCKQNDISSTVSIYLGLDNGEFMYLKDIEVGSNPSCAVLTDLDQDQDIDIIVSNQDDSTVSILFNNGKGDFDNQYVLPIGHYPSSVAVGTFDQDEFVDIIVTSQYDNSVSISFGKGDKKFSGQKVFKVGMEPSSLAIGDFNGDSCLDVAVTNSGDKTVSILLNNSTYCLYQPG